MGREVTITLTATQTRAYRWLGEVEAATEDEVRQAGYRISTLEALFQRGLIARVQDPSTRQLRYGSVV